MDDIDQLPFDLDPRIGIIVGVMVGFLVFAVSLDLTWEQLLRVIKKPKAPVIGLVAQFGILPAVAFLAGLYLTDATSIALGLLLVTCCPGGALSNYLTGVAKGDVATSISMTTVSTLFSIVLTPVLFAFWASMNPSTLAVLQDIRMDPQADHHDLADHVGHPGNRRYAPAGQTSQYCRSHPWRNAPHGRDRFCRDRCNDNWK